MQKQLIPGPGQRKHNISRESLVVPECQEGRKEKDWGAGGTFQEDTGSNMKEFISPSVKMEKLSD